MASGNKIDPMHQFEIARIVEVKLFGLDLSFTNSALWMVIVVGVVSLITLFGTSQRSVVPGRLQSLAEMAYEFVASTLTGVTGKEGMRFFPLVFSLFMFVLAANLLGLIPGSFTVTSHIIVTAAFALLVIGTVIVAGFVNHGTHFLHLFVPSGVPFVLKLVLLPIEVISFLSRPISLSLRLFGNMLAGHVALKLFGAFTAALLGAGLASILAPMSLLMAVTLMAFELLVAFLQAYVFTILTCVYLNDALHPGH